MGKVSRARIWQGIGGMNGSKNIAAHIGRFVGTFLIVSGVFQYFFGVGFGGLWLSLIGWFVIAAAQASRPKAPVTRMLSPLCVGAVMRCDCDTVSDDLDLQAFAEKYLRENQNRYYLVTKIDRVTGIIATKQVENIPFVERPFKTVGQVMCTVDDLKIVASQMPVAKAFATMENAELNQLVVASNDQITGIITRDDILLDLHTHVTVQTP